MKEGQSQTEKEIKAEGSERIGRNEQEANGTRDRSEQRMGNTKTTSLQTSSQIVYELEQDWRSVQRTPQPLSLEAIINEVINHSLIKENEQ
jgi:hypothetical protein